MKCLVFLFSLYMLCLTAVPCDPNDGCCEAERNMTAQQDKPSGKSDDKPIFPCSPFFACGANHGVVIPYTQIEFTQPELPVAKLHCFYSPGPHTISVPPVWQPPKSA